MNIFNQLKIKKQESHDTKKPVTLLIDGSAIAYAALHSVGYLSYNGKETGVIYGFLRKLLSLSKQFQTNKFIICWDSPINHRYTAYPQYKENRKKNKSKTVEDEIAYRSVSLQRTELAERVLPFLGFENNFIRDGFEGDDVLAYWALKLRKTKSRVIMVTSDNDMYQCLNHCDIWSPQKKKFFTEKHLLKEFGVSPDQWAFAKAIGGCDGDGVAGIVGASDPKKSSSKALKYILGKLNKGKILDRIESKEGQKIIKRNLPLVTLPYKDGDDELPRMILRRNTFRRDKFLKVFDELHFKSFLNTDNFKEWKKYFLEEV